MKTKPLRLFLLPACLILGVVLLVTFVSLSQKYLSGYLVENSKTLLGNKLDLSQVAAHLQDERLASFAKAPTESPVIFVFWSSTCAPCLEDMPKVSELHPGALLVPINTDVPTELASAELTLETLAPGFPFLHDKDRFLETSLKISHLPTHVIIDSQGFIKEFRSGRQTY